LATYDIVLTTYNIVSIEGKPFIEEEKEKASKVHFFNFIIRHVLIRLFV